MNLKTKHILITAGPTWVPIDSVRVISNIASGETGILLAQKLSDKGAKVTLLLGPVSSCCINKKIKVIPYKFFDELKIKLTRELKTKQYDAVIHSAAVSDYQLSKCYAKKVRSGIKNWQLTLTPTPKIISLIKKVSPRSLLVGFKFEPKANKKTLIREARKLMKDTRADRVVANTIEGNKYTAYLVRQNKVEGYFSTKNSLIRNLARNISLRI